MNVMGQSGHAKMKHLMKIMTVCNNPCRYAQSDNKWQIWQFIDRFVINRSIFMQNLAWSWSASLKTSTSTFSVDSESVSQKSITYQWSINIGRSVKCRIKTILDSQSAPSKTPVLSIFNLIWQQMTKSIIYWLISDWSIDYSAKSLPWSWSVLCSCVMIGW